MKTATKTRKPKIATDNFDALRLSLASPERIRAWSYGEVTKPETINYRTQRSEKHGLFDEKIFGPTRDYECYCGKYKGIRYKGIVCDKCGVEVTRSIVRRERMGHIELVTPVAHIWYLRAMPSRMAQVLGVPAQDLEKVIYFAGYIVTKVSEQIKKQFLQDLESEYASKHKAIIDDKERDALKERMTVAKSEIESVVVGRVFDEVAYHRFSVKYGTLFEAKIGAEAIYDIFRSLDLKELKATLEAKYTTAPASEREKLAKRIALITSMDRASIRPEWMFLTAVPVIPPALRPMVELEGGRHATSDVNDLYRRVINRNNRLKKLMDINAPEVILRNEKRILQEAVDALLDNSIRKGNASAGALTQAQRRPLKSLADYVKGKQGYFRQNLLGKRVDYSGRSVIVVGPDLELDECGVPKRMALELFRPFVIGELLARELAFNVRAAGRLIEDEVAIVWDILEEVINGKHVLLNRAPTLHRQSIQAFRPRLIEGDAIQLHPLVCPAFNADFDGDQMAIHVPLSEEAQWEAKHIMSANQNILKPGSGAPVVATSHDISLGIYWLTKQEDRERKATPHYESIDAAILAYEYGLIDLRENISVFMEESYASAKALSGGLLETTVGRLIFNSILPSSYPFVNEVVTKGVLQRILKDAITRYGLQEIPTLINRIKEFGFEYATKSGITWGMSDVVVPKDKKEIVQEAQERVLKIEEDFFAGLISSDERRRLEAAVWHGAKNTMETKIAETLNPKSSVHDIVKSGSRGSVGNLNEMAGMRGLIQNAQGETMEVPIISSMSEGLNPLEYFISAPGSRKGLIDTALGTARAGYLTRRLFDVAQDLIITEEDCGTKHGTIIRRTSASGVTINFAEAIRGRMLAESVGSFKKGHYITLDDAKIIEADTTIDSVTVRSPMTCESKDGICAHCYGMDLSTLEPIDLGEAVGTVAAQAIGEPGTQLTMRTFHSAGAATVGGDITTGLPRVEELLERRAPRNPALISKTDGVVVEIKEEGKHKVIIVAPEGDASTKIKGKKKTDTGSLMYEALYPRMPLVKEGDTVVKGQFLTDGSADLLELFEYAGREKTQEYIISETSKIYELQGAAVSRKHLEIIVRQMFSRVRIVETGESDFSVGDMCERAEYEEAVRMFEGEGKNPPKAREIVLGIKESALSRRSFLSAASFEQTTKVLINASLKGGLDPLKGLKENIILGRIIPAGTGFAQSKKAAQVRALQQKRDRLKEESEEV